MIPEPSIAVLEALDEPAALVDGSGVIGRANAAAARLLGFATGDLDGRALLELTADDPAPMRLMLRRCAGSGQAVVGTLSLRAADGELRKYQWRGCRVGGSAARGGAEGAPLLLLRLADASQDRFRVLTQKIVALNGEISHSRRIQLQLQAALDEKELLLRELHHRVKNNLQTLLGILSIAEGRAPLPEARAAIRDARLRVEAMAVLQRLLYRRDRLDGVDGRAFTQQVCENIQRSYGRPGITLELCAAELFIGLDLAAALGLILNELVTNAFKHAFPGRSEGRITVRLSQATNGSSRLMLVVEDDGCGLGAPASSGTGLALVQGLARQWGGTWQAEGSGGLRSTVTLREGGPRLPAAPS
ncbi:MAG TPA: sensor histidine kinase [Geminicoccaceae bacterium]|nr:sensor histidine kinase [Geminicoccaceae bacterium]